MQGFTCMTSSHPMSSCPNPSTACVFPPFLGTLPSSRSCAFLRGQICLLQECQPTLQSDVLMKPSFLPIGAVPRVPEPGSGLAPPNQTSSPLHVPALIFQSTPHPAHYLLESHKPAMTPCQTPQASPHLHLNLFPWCGVQRWGWLIHSLV